MSITREKVEKAEFLLLSQYAVRSAESSGRSIFEEPCRFRTCFQRDVDRIVHSKSFRRLKHKTQVFLQPEGDHYRTRMTHTLEVSRIARTISRALSLNEDLTEAIALGHDLGHTPFGHAGERALDAVLEGGFRHNEQSFRTVDKLEKSGAGLNLTCEVLNGILTHTGDKQPDTLEGAVVRLSDRVAYTNHDSDDAIRAGLLREEDIPKDIRETLGRTYSNRIDTIVGDIIESSLDRAEIRMSPTVAAAFEAFHEFMFNSVYLNPIAKGEEYKAVGILQKLFEFYRNNPENLSPGFFSSIEIEGIDRVVCDYISGMTDNYAVREFNRIFVPKFWHVL